MSASTATADDAEPTIQNTISESLEQTSKRPRLSSKSIQECARERTCEDACSSDEQKWPRCQLFECKFVLCTKHYNTYGYCSTECQKSSEKSASNAAADILPTVHNITKNCIALHNTIGYYIKLYTMLNIIKTK